MYYGTWTGCDTYLEEVDVDYNQNIFFTALTKSNRLIHNDWSLGTCTSWDERAGVVARIDNGALSWNKFIHGNFPDTDYILGLPWIGLSRSALKHTKGVYINYVAFYVRTSNQDWLFMNDASNGNIVNLQTIDSTPAGTFMHQTKDDYYS